jgi:hypothetical protein
MFLLASIAAEGIEKQITRRDMLRSQSKKKNRADSAQFVVTERRYGTGLPGLGAKGGKITENK